MQIPALHRISANIYIQSVREAFISLIPYLILISALTLVISIIQALTLLPENSSSLSTLTSINRSTYLLFPLVTMLALSFTLGKNLNQPPVACAILSLACFINLNNELIEIDRIIEGGYFDIQPYAMILPFIVVLSLKSIREKISYRFIQAPSISSHLQIHINLILPYILTFTLISSLLLFITPILTELIQPLAEQLQNSHLFIRGLVKTIATSLLWFLGIHGDNTYNLIADAWLNSEIVANNIDMSTMQDFYTLMGGSGNGLSLIIAMLLFSKDERSLKISKISLPFAIFNINELLIFGLPIVFNPYLLIPFVLVPTILYCCAYAAVSFGLIAFIPHDINWITPPIINTYIASADLNACFLQIALLAVGVAIYAPFVRMSHFYNHDREVAQKLALKLALGNLPPEKTITTAVNSPCSIAATLDDSGLLEEIMAGQLLLQYQPIINQSNFKVAGFEVLPHLKCSDGTLLGPEFLRKLQSPSLIEIIQLWQVKQLQKDIGLWQKNEQKTPEIYIAMNSSTLNHPRLIKTFGIELIHYRDKTHLCLDRDAFSGSLQLEANMEHILDTGIQVSLEDPHSESLPFDLLSSAHIRELSLQPHDAPTKAELKTPDLLLDLVDYAHKIGHRVRLNKIDDRKQLQQKCVASVDLLQGSIIAPRQTSEQVMAFIESWNSSCEAHKNAFQEFLT